MLTINPLPEALQGSDLSILSWFFEYIGTVQLPEHCGTGISLKFARYSGKKWQRLEIGEK